MMNKLNKYFVLLLILPFFVMAQKNNSFSMVVIYPQSAKISNELYPLVKEYEKSGLSESRKEKIKKENGNLKVKSIKEIEFLNEINIFSNITYSLSNFLDYKLFSKYEELLIYPIKINHNSTLISLKKISEKEKVNWVVDIKSLRIYEDKNELKGEVFINLYDNKSQKIISFDNINVGAENSGFEFSCEKNTMNCIINNLVKTMSDKILSHSN